MSLQRSDWPEMHQLHERRIKPIELGIIHNIPFDIFEIFAVPIYISFIFISFLGRNFKSAYINYLKTRGTMSSDTKYENTEPNKLPSNNTMKDLEIQREDETERLNTKQSAFKTLGWLDRFLAVWIFLAMAIGIILGNFVENTGPALQKGKFVGVSIPIGMFTT